MKPPEQTQGRNPWRCRHGFHAWFHVSITNKRTISIPGHSSVLCRLVEECRRCGIQHTTPAADLPKRWRVR